MNSEQIAKVALEANRAYCVQLGELPPPAWEDASSELRESLVSGVQFILNVPSSLPEHQHERWRQNRFAAGWTYGPIKDYEAKTHPCLVPFDQLTVEQQAKDVLFRNVVLTFLHIATSE